MPAVANGAAREPSEDSDSGRVQVPERSPHLVEELTRDLSRLQLVLWRPPARPASTRDHDEPQNEREFDHALPDPLGPSRPPPDHFQDWLWAFQENGHWYVVWSCPSAPHLAGIHSGPSAWPGIEERLPDRVYTYRSGVRLRGWNQQRYDTRRRYTYVGALRAYFSEREKHGAPRLCHIFFWA